MTSIKPTKAQQARAVSASECARLLGKDRGTVTRWLEQGCPTIGAAAREDGVEWRLDLGAVVAWLLAREREAEREKLEAKHAPELERLRRALEQAGSEDGEATTWQEARRRRTLAEARLRELEVRERSGELLDAKRTELEIATMGTGWRVRMMAMPSRAAVEVAGLDKPAACFAVLDREVREALEAVAGTRLDEHPPEGVAMRAVLADGSYEVIARALEASPGAGR